MKDNVIPAKATRVPLAGLDLRKLGLQEVGYVKRYGVQGKMTWVLHAADGTALSVQSTPDAVRNSALHQNLTLVSLH